MFLLFLVLDCCLLMDLLLSRFRRIRLCATPETAAHQAPPSLGFSRQEHWSGLPFPSPMQESEKWKWSCSVVPTVSDPMDYSPPGSSVHGIFQARVLEWGPLPSPFDGPTPSKFSHPAMTTSPHQWLLAPFTGWLSGYKIPIKKYIMVWL